MAKPAFEIGLVMAGAVSAGSYTAGVLDFLYEALHLWYADHGGNPPHDVRIRVMTGSSAGGMCAGISALQFLDVPRYQQPQSSKLYNSWVKRVDIGPMLGDGDLKEGKVRSLLDSQIIDDIANDAFRFKPDFGNVPPFVADYFHLILTVTNTRGISYEVKFEGNQLANPYVLTNQGDFLHFAFKKPGTETKPFDPLFDSPVLIDKNEPPEASWSLLNELCKATGAFPLGLRARRIRQPGKHLYDLRFPPNRAINVPPQADFNFIAIDGGVINNEPFDLCHDVLAGGRGRVNPNRSHDSDRAVIMIDPFPSAPVSYDYDDTKDELKDVATAFFTSLRRQALFKPDELQKALDENYRSRFLISPKRPDPRGKTEEKYHVAGGAIGAFSGFVHETFRAHDYQLGRRNAQHFFRKHFTLAEANPLFSQWTPEFRKAVTDRYGDMNQNLPIIPLADSLWTEVQLPSWPSISMNEFDKKVARPMRSRAREIGKVFIGGFARTLWQLGAHRIVSDKIVKAFCNELKKAELIK